MPKKLSQKEFEKRVYNKLGNEYKVVSKYKTIGENITIYHNKCNNYYTMKANTILNKGGKCPYCYGNIKNIKRLKKLSKNQRKTKKEFNKQIKNKSNDIIEVLGEYKTRRNKIKVKCINCENEWYMRPDAILRGDGCQKCSSRQSKEKVNQRIQEVTFNNYELIGGYTRIHDKAKIKHKLCNNILKISVDSFLNSNRRCLKCFDSSAEGIIYDYLNYHNISFKYQSKFKKCKNIKSLSFDFQIFRKNDFVLFELNGEHHFKNIYNKNKLIYTKKLDNIKRKFCKKNNIDLYTIYYINSNHLLNHQLPKMLYLIFGYDKFKNTTNTCILTN